ncbi:MAG: 50S ribosomal protein L25 [Desulfovibrionaceae bacterium]|nr:50S ribosomal protein L25 [Desulfovibrionaceae bacterium]MBF0513878.1 50S ribosomal protein L25 [Desulfovibrionaceae bacterium]
MKEKVSLAVSLRQAKGKGQNRRLRAETLVPGVYYAAGGENLSVQAEDLPLARAYHKVGTAHILDLVIDMGGKTETKPVLIRQIQRHPLKSKITHVDFYGVDLTKEIRVQVPVMVIGKAKGLVMGGLVEIFRDTVEVACLPLEIPDNITIDVSDLGIGDNIAVDELVMPQGVRAIFEDHYAVVGVVAPEAEAAPAAAAETAAS